MAISPISSVNNNVKNLSFGENNEKPDTEKRPQISAQTKVLIGAGLAALAAVGIYIATRGKTKGTTEKPLEQLKEMAVSQFKNAGNKFEKGKALTSTGEAYTGTLIHTTKDGKNIILKYENGLLVESKGEKFQKLYKYDNFGNLTEINNGKGQVLLSKSINGDTTYVKLYVNPIAKGHITKNGKLKYVIDKDNNITFYNSDSSIPSGSKLVIRKAGTKGVGEYMLGTPNGEKFVYNCTPDSSGESTVILKQILFTNPKNKQKIEIFKEKYKDDGTIEYYIRNRKGKSIETSIYNQHKELLEGTQAEEVLPIIKYVKNIHKDIYKMLDDFGGVNKFSERYR